MFYYIFQLNICGKYIVVCKEYILFFRLIIHVLNSSTHIFTTIYIVLLFGDPRGSSTGWIMYLGLGVMRLVHRSKGNLYIGPTNSVMREVPDLMLQEHYSSICFSTPAGTNYTCHLRTTVRCMN